jgi:branched-chain amino acid transport system substrate-binding protein
MFNGRSKSGRNRTVTAAALAALVVVGAVACGSSGSSSSAGASGATVGSGGGLKNFTVGVLTDLTGPAASESKTTPAAVKAGTYYAARNGYKIKYVVADTGTNPTTTMTAAQKLVTRDHVGAVIAVSSVTTFAANYLTARKIPVIGAGIDGPEWLTAKNMFTVTGAIDGRKVATTFGKVMTKLGVTNVGAVGYGVSPVSAENAKSSAASAETAGIKVGYLNANFPFGGTNVGPMAIAMKSNGVNGWTAATVPSTAYALVAELKNQGVKIEAALLGTGYGGDLTQAGPSALATAQNVYYEMTSQPFSMNTAATKQMAADLKSAGAPTNQATYAQYAGYLSVGLLVAGLKGAGDDPSGPSLISSLSKIHTWTGLGLLGMNVDINDRTSFVAGPNNCAWVTQLKGKSFVGVKGMLPICGTVVPGRTVSSSS